MHTNRRPSRIVYKYVESPQPTPAASIEEPEPLPSKDSMAYRAWANCYQPPTVHFDLSLPTPTASALPVSSAPSSRSNSTSTSSSCTSSASSHTSNSNPSTKVAKTPKPGTHSSPAILTSPSTKATKPHPPPSPPLARPATRPVERLYTTTTTTVTTKNGTFVNEHRVVSTHGFHDGKGAVGWSGFRNSDWDYPLHKKVKGKRVLASYPHCQVW